VVKIIIQTVSDNKNEKRTEELKMEVLHLGIALLIGGNEKVQEKFLEELVNQRQN